MYNNIAVILRGHVRTWHMIYPHVFKFYESLAHNVDYYFYTWKSQHSQDVPDTFTGKNLIAFHQLDSNSEFATSWRGPAFFNYLSLYYMRPKHSKDPYDFIVDSRPDVLSRIRYDYLSLGVHEKKKVYVPYLELQTCTQTKKPSIALADHFLIFTDLDIIEKLSHRMYYDSPTGNQVGLRKLIQKTDHGINTIRNVDSRIVRPNIASVKNEANIILDNNNELQLDWCMRLSVEEKVKFCENNKVDPKDYITYSSLAKIWSA